MMAERQLRLKGLRESIDAGLEQLAAGDRVSADEVFAKILEGLGQSEASPSRA